MAGPGDYGHDIELRAVEALRERGYQVHQAVAGRHRYGGQFRTFTHDIFGTIDLVAKKAGEPRTRWIQVTVSHSVEEKRRQLRAGPWDLRCDSVEIWQWKPVGRGQVDPSSGETLPGSYFQVYLLDQDFAKIHSNRFFVTAHKQQQQTSQSVDMRSLARPRDRAAKAVRQDS